MRTLFLFAALFSLASCKKQAAGPTYDYTCTAYAISPSTGDTSLVWSQYMVGQPITAQQMQDSLDGPNPFNYVICN